MDLTDWLSSYSRSIRYFLPAQASAVSHCGRGWFRFSLRTFFVVLTIFGVWLGVQVKWIKDRREVRAWTEAHRLTEPFVGEVWPPLDSARPVRRFPWSLAILGEQAERGFLLAIDRESKDEIVKVREIESLFPEAIVAAAPIK